MKHKLIIIPVIHTLALAVLFSLPLAGYTDDIPPEQQSQLAILNVKSSSVDMDPGKLSILTDIFRTELFRLNLFKVLDRSYIEKILDEQKLSMAGIIQESSLLKIGKLLTANKLFICSLERFSDTILALNVRIINVDSSLIDFSDIIFIKNETQIFDAIQEIVKNIELNYRTRKDVSQPVDQAEFQTAKWKFLGANPDEIASLITNNLRAEQFLELRQYDIAFTITEFLDAYRKGWDMEVIKIFLQKGIGYRDVKQSLGYGIINLTNYNANFKPAGLRYDEYLEAYSKHLLTPEEYLDHKKGYQKDKLHYGIGGVADSIPILTAGTRFPLLLITWEHFFTDYQRNKSKRSIDVGAIMFNGIAPAPYSQYNWYFGEYPFYFKTGFGFAAELILGGHIGLYAHAGVEVKEKYEFSFILAFLGTQPGVSYTDLKTQIGEPKYVGIQFPYAAAVFKLK